MSDVESLKKQAQTILKQLTNFYEWLQLEEFDCRHNSWYAELSEATIIIKEFEKRVIPVHEELAVLLKEGEAIK